jgi:hypothetical protein
MAPATKMIKKIDEAIETAIPILCDCALISKPISWLPVGTNNKRRI